MKIRLDQLVVARELASTREEAKRLILAGKIRLDSTTADKAGRLVSDTAQIQLEGPASPYVSRGGEKLAGALERFGIEIPRGGIALDIGASTGGFTDCLLQRGAENIVAVDVGRGQIHERLRSDPRVRLLEKTNARHLTLEAIGGNPADLIVVDVSFISLKLILPVCANLLGPNGILLALIKPQFEAGKNQVGKGGIVRDPKIHASVIESIIRFCAETGWEVRGLMVSPLLGAGGNVEFFSYLARPRRSDGDRATSETPKIDVEGTLRDAYNLQNR